MAREIGIEGHTQGHRDTNGHIEREAERHTRNKGKETETRRKDRDRKRSKKELFEGQKCRSKWRPRRERRRGGGVEF